jgi:hypothetical protein
LPRYSRSASECAGAQSVDCIRFLLPMPLVISRSKATTRSSFFRESGLLRFARNDGLKFAASGIGPPMRQGSLASDIPKSMSRVISENRN